MNKKKAAFYQNTESKSIDINIIKYVKRKEMECSLLFLEKGSLPLRKRVNFHIDTTAARYKEKLHEFSFCSLFIVVLRLFYLFNKYGANKMAIILS